MCTHVAEGPRTRHMWERKQNNWPKVNKDLKELSYIRDLNHLFTALLLIREDAIPFLSGCIFLPCF